MLPDHHIFTAWYPYAEWRAPDAQPRCDVKPGRSPGILSIKKIVHLPDQERNRPQLTTVRVAGELEICTKVNSLGTPQRLVVQDKQG